MSATDRATRAAKLRRQQTGTRDSRDDPDHPMTLDSLPFDVMLKVLKHAAVDYKSIYEAIGSWALTHAVCDDNAYRIAVSAVVEGFEPREDQLPAVFPSWQRFFRSVCFAYRDTIVRWDTNAGRPDYLWDPNFNTFDGLCHDLWYRIFQPRHCIVVQESVRKVFTDGGLALFDPSVLHDATTVDQIPIPAMVEDCDDNGIFGPSRYGIRGLDCYTPANPDSDEETAFVELLDRSIFTLTHERAYALAAIYHALDMRHPYVLPTVRHLLPAEAVLKQGPPPPDYEAVDKALLQEVRAYVQRPTEQALWRMRRLLRQEGADLCASSTSEDRKAAEAASGGQGPMPTDDLDVSDHDGAWGMACYNLHLLPAPDPGAVGWDARGPLFHAAQLADTLLLNDIYRIGWPRPLQHRRLLMRAVGDQGLPPGHGADSVTEFQRWVLDKLSAELDLGSCVRLCDRIGAYGALTGYYLEDGDGYRGDETRNFRFDRDEHGGPSVREPPLHWTTMASIGWHIDPDTETLINSQRMWFGDEQITQAWMNRVWQKQPQETRQQLAEQLREFEASGLTFYTEGHDGVTFDDSLGGILGRAAGSPSGGVENQLRRLVAAGLRIKGPVEYASSSLCDDWTDVYMPLQARHAHFMEMNPDGDDIFGMNEQPFLLLTEAIASSSSLADPIRMRGVVARYWSDIVHAAWEKRLSPGSYLYSEPMDSIRRWIAEHQDEFPGAFQAEEFELEE